MTNILQDNLDKFYSIQKNIDTFLLIINDKTISLRVIDWFVTNYSKKNSTFYLLYQKGKTKSIDNIKESRTVKFDVYNSYKSQLKSYSKKNFDPFCRRYRINKTYFTNDINTTVGQLNFFKWGIENYLFDYITKKYNQIELDMNNSIKYNKHVKKNKRKELSKSIYNGLNSKTIQTTLYFD
jgi:hypothetical protein